jgi:hypothetical protein
MYPDYDSNAQEISCPCIRYRNCNRIICNSGSTGICLWRGDGDCTIPGAIKREVTHDHIDQVNTFARRKNGNALNDLPDG